MRKMVVAVLAAGMLAATGGVLYSAGEAFGSTVNCVGTPGTLPGTTINSNVNVPSGSWCNIQGQTVNGNINVAPGGGLVVGSGSTINGNINATNPGSFVGNPCGGGSGHFSVVIGTATVTGTTSVTGAPADVTLGGNGCGGGVFKNNVYLNSNHGPVSLHGENITGNAQVQNNTGPTPIVANNTVSNILYCSPATGSGNKAKTIYGTCTF